MLFQGTFLPFTCCCHARIIFEIILFIVVNCFCSQLVLRYIETSVSQFHCRLIWGVLRGLFWTLVYSTRYVTMDNEPDHEPKPTTTPKSTNLMQNWNTKQTRRNWPRLGAIRRRSQWWICLRNTSRHRQSTRRPHRRNKQGQTHQKTDGVYNWH